MKIAVISIADYVEAVEGMPHDAERLYFRMILKMYSREGGLPDDDDENARMFGYRDVRTFKHLKAQLVARRVVEIVDGHIVNTRVADEVEDIKSRKAAAAKSGRIGGRSKGDRREIEGRSAGDRPEIGGRSTPDVESILYTTSNKNNDLAQASPSPSPSPKEKPLLSPQAPRVEKPVGRPGAAFWSKALIPPEPDEHRSAEMTDDGRIVLFNGERAEWLKKFGSAERLDLALDQAAGWIQPNGSRPLLAQIRAQLARSLAEKIDRDKRAEKAAKPDHAGMVFRPSRFGPGRWVPREEATQ